jgi:hypothetical protein
MDRNRLLCIHIFHTNPRKYILIRTCIVYQIYGWRISMLCEQKAAHVNDCQQTSDSGWRFISAAHISIVGSYSMSLEVAVYNQPRLSPMKRCASPLSIVVCHMSNSIRPLLQCTLHTVRTQNAFIFPYTEIWESTSRDVCA